MKAFVNHFDLRTDYTTDVCPEYMWEMIGDCDREVAMMLTDPKLPQVIKVNTLCSAIVNGHNEEFIRSLANTLRNKFGHDGLTISNVKTIYAEGQPIGVKVYFADGTDEKAICEEGDRSNFNLDFGITICLCKKLMGGSKAYNQKMKTIRKEMEDRAYAVALAKEKERQAKQEKHQEKLKAAQKKRDAREREIEIQKEAYLRAMREFESAKQSDHD